MAARLSPFQKKRMGMELSQEDILVLHDPEEAFWVGFRYGVDMSLLLCREDGIGEKVRAGLEAFLDSEIEGDA